MKIQQLQWHCRRGLLELDVLLDLFLKDKYEDLDSNQQQTFVDLLERSDQDLIDWLLADKPVPPNFVEIVAQIKTTKYV